MLTPNLRFWSLSTGGNEMNTKIGFALLLLLQISNFKVTTEEDGFHCNKN
jgi:hypothetical protein